MMAVSVCFHTISFLPSSKYLSMLTLASPIPNSFPRNYLGKLADTISPRWKVVRAPPSTLCAFAEYNQVGEYDFFFFRLDFLTLLVATIKIIRQSSLFPRSRAYM